MTSNNTGMMLRSGRNVVYSTSNVEEEEVIEESEIQTAENNREPSPASERNDDLDTQGQAPEERPLDPIEEEEQFLYEWQKPQTYEEMLNETVDVGISFVSDDGRYGYLTPDQPGISKEEKKRREQIRDTVLEEIEERKNNSVAGPSVKK